MVLGLFFSGVVAVSVATRIYIETTELIKK